MSIAVSCLRRRAGFLFGSQLGLAGVALLGIAALALGACGGSSSDTASGGSDLSAGGTPAPGAAASKAPPAAATPAGAAPPAGASTLVFDPKNQQTGVLVKVDPTEADGLLHQLFPSFLTDQANCADDVQGLADARARGQIVPVVGDKLVGAITAPGKNESLYLVSVGECGASHADEFGSAMFVVSEGGKITVQALLEGQGSTSIHRVLDAADGTKELVLTNGFSNMGETDESAELAKISTTGVTVIKDFGQVYTDNCGGTDDPLQESFQVITQVANGSGGVAFSIQNKTAPCDS